MGPDLRADKFKLIINIRLVSRENVDERKSSAQRKDLNDSKPMYKLKCFRNLLQRSANRT